MSAFALPGTATVSGMSLIQDSILGSANTFDFQSIPGTYSHLKIVIQGRATGAVAGRFSMLRFNNDSGANYDCEWFTAFGTAAANLAPTNDFNATSMAHVVEMPGASAPSNMPGQAEITIPNYAGTTFNKTAAWFGGTTLLNDANGQRTQHGAGVWKSTVAITRIQILLASSDTFVAGSRMTLYGLA